MNRWQKKVVVLIGVLAAAAIVVGSVQGASPEPTPGHVHVMQIFRGQKNGGRPVKSVNMTYHGGPVETAPKIYIDFWGSWWGTSTTTGSDGAFSYTNILAENYITNFFTGVGATTWEHTVSQYCQGVAVGTTNCGSAGSHIVPGSGQLAGVWNDPSTVPSSPSQSQIAAEALVAAQHFPVSTSPTGATIFVFTPSHDSMSGFGTSWCAWHSVTTTSSGSPLPYAYMPYQPDAGASCGENFVNAASGSGNGYFDGFSIVGGHEYAEAETDPVTSSGSYAWYDQQGSEIGDKCAWSSASGNISVGGSSYAVQPLWSNAVSSCAMSG